MNELDFQVGDVVTCILHGEGHVSHINNNIRITFPVLPIDIKYTKKGKLYHNKYNKRRTLFHGHNLEVKVNEKKPNRYKWVNILLDGYGVPYFKDETYTTKARAINNIREDEKNRYIATIQLKPESEDD